MKKSLNPTHDDLFIFIKIRSESQKIVPEGKLFFQKQFIFRKSLWARDAREYGNVPGCGPTGNQKSWMFSKKSERKLLKFKENI